MVELPGTHLRATKQQLTTGANQPLPVPVQYTCIRGCLAISAAAPRPQQLQLRPSGKRQLVVLSLAPPPARTHRAGQRRLEEQRPGTYAVGQVHHERCLSSVRGHSVQPYRHRGRANADTWLIKTATATIRQKLVAVPARLSHRSRRLVLHLPENWKWEPQWPKLFDHTHGPVAAWPPH